MVGINRRRICSLPREDGVLYSSKQTLRHQLISQELCTTLKNKYDGDATKLRVEGKDALEKLKSRLKEFKGIGITSQNTGLMQATMAAKSLSAALKFGGMNYSRSSTRSEADPEQSN